jgi:hypothetical protein
MVKPGNYNEQLVNVLPNGATLRGSDSNPGNWPSLKPTNNVVGHQAAAVRFTSNRTSTVTFKYFRVDLSSITSGNRPHGCFGFASDPSVHLLVEDFECIGPASGMAADTGAGLFGTSGGGIQIYRRGSVKNWISGMDHPSNNPGAHGIYQQGSNGMFEYLYIENVNGRCFRTRNTSGSRNNTFRYIYCKKAAGPSLLDGPISPSGNIAYNVVLWNAAGLAVHDGSKVYNATVIGGSSGRCVRTRRNANHIRNSILLNCTGSAIIDEGTNSVISHNLITGSLADIFTDPTKGNFSLKSGSPAINAGTSLAGIACDGACDQGALEYGQSTFQTQASNLSQPLLTAPGSLQATAQ